MPATPLTLGALPMMLRRYHKTPEQTPVPAPEEPQEPATPESVEEGVEDGSGPEPSNTTDAAPKTHKRSR